MKVFRLIKRYFINPENHENKIYLLYCIYLL